MVELFNYNELNSDKVSSRSESKKKEKKKEGDYQFEELEEIKDIKGTLKGFSLVYGQEHRVEGKRIQEAAKQLSREMIEDAKNKVTEIEKTAYDKGKQEAFENGRQQIKVILDMFQKKIEELFEHQKDIINKSEEDILNLTLSLTSRIIHHEVRTQKDIVLNTIKAAMGKILNQEQITIRINPDDMDYVLRNKPELKDALNNIQQVSFKEDDSVSSGGCIIDTNSGSIYALLEKEFEEFEKMLRKEFTDSKEKREQRE